MSVEHVRKFLTPRGIRKKSLLAKKSYQPIKIVYSASTLPLIVKNCENCKVSFKYSLGNSIYMIMWILIYYTRLTQFTETGTICSLIYDIPKQTITTLLAFSQGHWEKPEDAHGDKRNAKDFERWRGLAKIGCQTDRFMLNEQASIVESFMGKGDLEPISGDEETIWHGWKGTLRR